MSGVIMYAGPSVIDGSPIVAIVNGFADAPSRNDKTGKMLQQWILPAEIDPVTARQTCQDIGMCGACRIRRQCYVVWHTAPLQVWRAWRDGSYPRLDLRRRSHRQAFAGRRIRLGACGDPVAVPIGRTRSVLRWCAGHNGYTHQHEDPRHAQWRGLLMASCETLAMAQDAARRGWRTFRIGNIPQPREVLCPSARVQCDTCMLCGGADRPARNILNPPHGGPSRMVSLLKIIDN